MRIYFSSWDPELRGQKKHRIQIRKHCLPHLELSVRYRTFVEFGREVTGFFTSMVKMNALLPRGYKEMSSIFAD
jgi:hypothetical protein